MSEGLDLYQLQKSCIAAKTEAESKLYSLSFQAARAVEEIQAFLSEASITSPECVTAALTNSTNLHENSQQIIKSLENKIKEFEVQIKAAEATRASVS